MASKLVNPGLPAGFESPFKRAQMEERMDDSIACVATISNRPMAEVKKMAFDLGLPQHGPFFVTEEMLVKLLAKAGNLVGSKYKEFEKFDLLPDVAILLIDYDEETEIGRHVVWHHVRGSKDQPAFHYVIDVGQWLDPADQVTTAIKKFAPAYYIEVTAKATGRAK